MNLFVRAAIIWLGLFVLAFVNGALRVVLMKNVIGVQELLAHQLSCLTGAILWTALVWLSWGFLRITSTAEAVAVGTGWLLATLLTETFLLNRLIGRMTWEQILKTYNVAQGEFWGLVLLYIGLLPIMIFWLKPENP